MKVLSAISNIKKIVIPKNCKEVVRTVADELKAVVTNAEIIISSDGKNPELDSVFYIGFGSDYTFEKHYFDNEAAKYKNGFFQFCLDDNGGGKLIASKEGLLYSAFRYVMEFLSAKETKLGSSG